MLAVLKYDAGKVSHDAKHALLYADRLVDSINNNFYALMPAVQTDQTFYWSHELTILRICQAVRCGRIKTNEIRIHAENGEVVDVDVKGQFIQPWPTDLFELAFYCQFTKYDKICHIPGRSTFDPDTVEWKQ